MVKLQPWQWIVLIAPIAAVVVFLLVSAGMQIHTWGLSWIWAVVGVVFVGWRWLLVKWTRPVLLEVEEAMAELSASLPQKLAGEKVSSSSTQVQTAEKLQAILEASAEDAPVWQDLNRFRERCLELVTAIALIHAPQAKQPLLNIYVPQAYGLLRGTIDDLDQWMEKLSPVLNKLTIAQAYEYYEITQKLAPSAQKVWKFWQKARWLINPAAAAANTATRGIGNRANEELIGNLSQLLREQLLRNLAKGAIALYAPQPISPAPASPAPAPQASSPIALSSAPIEILEERVGSAPRREVMPPTLQTLLTQTQPTQTALQTQPLNLLLLGRTSAGKSSLINTLFTAPTADTDTLPNTDRLRNYQWQTPDGESVNLWDTPGYEQADRRDLRDIVLDHARRCDVILLVTPALDPALQMDLDILTELREQLPDRPIIGIVTQVDRLRPIREWQPPYNWETGTRPKELAIRDALSYRRDTFPPLGGLFPLVTYGPDRTPWGIDPIARRLIETLDPSQQARLARFLTSLEAQAFAAENLIDRYRIQITTTQGLTALLKGPTLAFLSTRLTGTPELGKLLATQIPIEQLPLVIGKLQLAYDLYTLLTAVKNRPFDFLALWDVLIQSSGESDRDARAFGRLMVEYWTEAVPADQLRSRLTDLLARENPAVS